MKETWLQTSAQQDIVQRSLRVAILVGTILAVINHGDKLLAFDLDAITWLKIFLSYLVPYCVSTWSAVQTARQGAGD